MNRILYYIVLLTGLLFLSACGNSGTSSEDSTVQVTAPGSGTNSGTVSPTVASTCTVALVKSALQLNETTTVSATFKKNDGTPVSGISVTFSSTLGAILPTGGVATTDANGTASVSLVLGATSGQGQITASATIDNKQVIGYGSFSVSLPPLKLSPISLGLTTLSQKGITDVSVTVTDANGLTYTNQEVDVYFSTKTTSGTASIPASVRTIKGVAIASFSADTATGTATITASISGSTVTSSLTINTPNPGSIAFVSALPKTIGLKGMGGAGIQETSVVTFKVFDTSGAPKANQPITFSLNSKLGGISMLGSEPFGSGNPVTSSTLQDGTASITVLSGSISTPVRVTATLTGTNTTIATQSDQLVVSTGIPSQDGFSISIATLNTESWNTDGVQDVVTARLSDHFHNPVPDGTAVYFTTSGGSIQPSCVTVGGACSVTWTSQEPRPSNGRARILAYTIGEESFLDLDGNGVANNSSAGCFDIIIPSVGAAKQCGEFVDTPEAFRDDNENGIRDASETFIDFNGDGNFNGPDGSYNGVLQGTAYIGAPKSKHVFSNSTLVMASSGALITNSCGSSVALSLGNSKSCEISISDVNGNTMPAGTKVAFSFTEVVAAIKLTSDDFTFPNSAANSGVTLNVILTDDGTAPVGRGVLKVTVTSPGGVVTTRNYSVN